MQFGLFGSAAARRGGPEFDSSEGFRDFIDYNIEAEALGFHSTFVRRAWPGLGDHPFSHCGRYWQFDNIVVEPPTAQRPHPPIWMGAGSKSEKDHLEPAIGSRRVRASGNAATQRTAIAQNPCASKRSKIGPQASVSRAVAAPMPTVP
jgi:hypothetical protein